MPIKIQNAEEAGLTQRAITTAQFILDLLEQVEFETEALETMHWYGDLPNTQDARDNLICDLRSHTKALCLWTGNITIKPVPSLPTKMGVDATLLRNLQTFIET